MPLFQNTVVQKYLKNQNAQEIQQKWGLYKLHFFDAQVQGNIRNSKEEQYQEGFLRDLFVNILGYTLNPNNNYNLTTEYKNIKDSKKADGAIVSRADYAPMDYTPRGNDPLDRRSEPMNFQVKAVIELKGTNTTDLGKIETQAFGYKNNQEGCTYVITSNFEKLRFYIDNAIEYLEFNLFTLSEQDFKLLYLCLAYENLSKDLPKKLKAESLSQEDAITKKLYKDYSVFKRELFQSLTQLNPEIDKLLLFKKSQKLLDRFLFLFFAEDRHLLPPNSVRIILEQWVKLRELDAYIPLYERFQKYFGYLNTGYKGKQHDVFAYNGGLFKPDEVLDKITIDDELLYNHTLKLSEYDFVSEVDVNILGHIFENSLTEIEEIETQLNTPMGHDPLESKNDSLEKNKTSKRKKDGVFYTPKYITKYIVENTVGKLCLEKKDELAIIEEEYSNGLKPIAKKQQLEKLNDYRNWLLQLTIVDPACGSGAFLNEALNFLIAEHKLLDELETKLMGGGLIFPNIENSILENNLFGVDINEESVEIAKLSLWLRTAQPNRKLNDLSGNIKCGNSLIDDPSIAGDKAFNWQKEFTQVFKEKFKHAYHLVFTTHNSRVSQQMIEKNIQKGEPLELSLEMEIELTKILKDIILENNYKVLAYNICKDHVHLLLVCEEEELTSIVQKIKSISSKLFNRISTLMGHDPLEHKNHLWSQKFFFAQLDDFIWADISNKPGEVFVDSYLDNAIAYIEGNRAKHNLPHSAELKNTINQFVTSTQEAFATEYKGGFDVVIGNPPYGAKINTETQNYLNKKYIKGGSETAISFIKLAYDALLKTKGEFGFIIPKSFTFSSNYDSIRNFILEDISEIIDCKKVWKEVLLEQIIFFFKKKNKVENYKSGILDRQEIKVVGEINKSTFEEFGFFLNGISEVELNIGQKINSSKKYIKDIAQNSRGGIFQNKISDVGDIDVLGGAEIQRNGIVGIKGRIERKEIENDQKCFIKNNSVLVQRLIAHIENPTEHIKITACLPERNDFAIVDTINQITFNEKYNAKVFWCLFNSKLINWYAFRFILAKAIRTMQFDNPITNRIPIPSEINQHPFIEKADLMLGLNEELQRLVQKFQRTIQREFGIEKLSKKLENWYDLNFAEFLKELSKSPRGHKNNIPRGHDPLESKNGSNTTPMGHDPLGRKNDPLEKRNNSLGLKEKAEWEDYFLAEQKNALKTKQQINQTDKKIDQMVYELYGLTEEEITLVEEK